MDEFHTRPSTSGKLKVALLHLHQRLVVRSESYWLRCLVSHVSEQLTQKSKDWSCAETKLMSDMTLAWTDEDEDGNTVLKHSEQTV